MFFSLLICVTSFPQNIDGENGEVADGENGDVEAGYFLAFNVNKTYILCCVIFGFTIAYSLRKW